MDILLRFFIISFLFGITNVYGAWDWFQPESEVTLSDNVKIKGKVYTLSSNKKYAAFMGIPYAKPPVQNLRFEPPEMNEIKQTIEAKNLGSSCVQEKDGKLSGDENCLFLNVYTPWPLNENKKYPVMFWIHGGAFSKGDGGWQYYGADYLLEQDVIVVTINYRLGVFGFLTVPDLQIYGNMGLKDQRLALQWVNKHIEKFKGDKNRVTIFGQSAGAASVHYLMLDSSTKDWYTRAILQSGSAVNPWASQFKPEERFKNLTLKLKNQEFTKENLQKLSAKDLFEAAKKVPTSEDQRRATDPVFNPVVEDKKSTNPIIEQEVRELMDKENKFPDKAVLMGFNNAEGLLAMERVQKDSKEINDTLNDMERVIPRDFNIWLKPNDPKVEEALKKLKEVYHLNNNTIWYIELMGDAWFNYGVFETLHKIVNLNKRNQKTYFYKLSDDSYSVYKEYVLTKYKDLPGVCHSDDLGYLFKMYHSSGLISASIPSKAQLTHRRMVKMWTNFAKTGDPLPKEENNGKSQDSDLKGLNWVPVDKKDIQYLDIAKEGTTMRKFNDLEDERYELWKKLYEIGKEFKQETNKPK